MPRIATGRNSEISTLVIKIAVVGTVGGMILTGKKRSGENKNNLDQYTHIHTLTFEHKFKYIFSTTRLN